MSSEIESAAEEQSTTAEDINGSIVNISDMTDATALAAEQTSVVSGNMSRMAEDLQKMVSNFTV